MVYIFSTPLIAVSATFSIPSCARSSSAVCGAYWSHRLVHLQPSALPPQHLHLSFSAQQFPFIYLQQLRQFLWRRPPRLLLILSFYSFLFCFHLCHCGAFPFSLSSSLSLSLTFVYALSILSRSSVITFLPVKCWIQGPLPLPLPVAMTTASVFSFIGVGWKEGGGGWMLPSVVTQI